MGVMLNGETIGDVDENGEPVRDDTFLIMLNCHHEPIQFYVPKGPTNERWEIIVDTNEPDLQPDTRFVEQGQAAEIVPLSFVLAREAKRPTLTDIISPDRR